MYFCVVFLCVVFFRVVLFAFFLCCIFRVVFFRVIYFCAVLFVLYFLCYIFCVVLKAFHSMKQPLLIYVHQIFGQTLKKKVSIKVGKLGLIHYLVICPCLFQNYLSVSELNFLLLFLLFSLIYSIHNDTVQLD